MGISAVTGDSSSSIKVNRPSWIDMKKYYPADGVEKEQFYPKISKKLAENAELPMYTNTCALRMSYALTRSGLKLGRAPLMAADPNKSEKKSRADVLGDDGNYYWLRVSELKQQLESRFKKPDVYFKFPSGTPLSWPERLKSWEKFEPLEKRKMLVYDGFLKKIAGKNGIIVFGVSGWNDATGHFTLLDGGLKKDFNIFFKQKDQGREVEDVIRDVVGSLLYVGAQYQENDPLHWMHYFWRIPGVINGVKVSGYTTEVSFWELK